MRWIGWVLSGLMVVIFMAIYHAKTGEVDETTASVKERIQSKTQETDQILRVAEESLAPLEKRAKEEETKTAGLQNVHAELSGKKASLESSISQLNAALDALTTAKEDAKGSRQDNQAEIGELQKKITVLENQVTALVKAVGSVTEKVGM